MMTDEERAYRCADRIWQDYKDKCKCYTAVKVISMGYLEGMADERKRLAKEGVCWQCDMDATIAQNMQLKNLVKELQRQIKKMERCVNCKHLYEHNTPLCRSCTHDGTHIHDGKETDKWELME